MKRIKIVFVALFQVVLLTSCLTTKQTNLLREPGGSIPAYPEVAAIGEYTIKPGDELNVFVSVPSESSQTGALYSLFSVQGGSGSSEESKLRALSVTPEGTIYFPYVGDLHVVGKTTLEIQEELERTINEKMLKEGGSCLVQVSLGNRYFSVIGESRAGRYPIAKEQTTIFQALSQSGDVNLYGDRSHVNIIRQTATGTIRKTFDLRSADVVNSEFYYIQPNDVIYIQPLKRQFWGLSSFGSVFAIISTIGSVGIMIYNLTK